MYVRTGAEEVFDALMLNSPTLSGLREAVSNTEKPFPVERFTYLHLTLPPYLFISSLTHVPFFVPPFRCQKSMACPKIPSERSTKSAREGESLLLEGDQLHSGGNFSEEGTHTRIQGSVCWPQSHSPSGKLRLTDWMGWLWNALIVAL